MFRTMKTKKQVMAEFVRLQKRYADLTGFVAVQVYNQDEGGDFWAVELTCTHFGKVHIDWRESVQWMHYSHQDEAREAEMAARVEEFIKRMEERV